MAIAIAEIPGWLWVKNPVRITINGGVGELQYAKIQVYNGLSMLSEGYYVANGDQVIADISGFLKPAFNLVADDRPPVALYAESETYLNLDIVILVNDTDTEVYNETHTFIFGGKDIRDDFTIDDYVMVSAGTTFPDFLIEFERLTIWKDQPHDIRFTADIGKSITFGLLCYDANFSQTAINLTIPAQTYRNILKVDPTALSTPIPDDTVWIAISIKNGDDDEGYILADYITPDCSNGVLLRWINRLGGIHLWYFRKRDTKRPVKTTTVPLPESENYSLNYSQGITKVVDKEKQTNITIGAEHVKISDYDIIAGITDSDRVDMYMGSGRWMQVIVADTDFNTAHENDYQDIEFTIVTV